MNKIKLMIIISFAVMIISAAIGVAVYYSYLQPFRVAANTGNLEDVLSHVTYLEYNATDQDGNVYLVKLWNNPSNKSGKAELYVNNQLNYTFYYSYSGTGLSYGKIEYANGTVREYAGADVVLIEDYFLTSLAYSYNQQNNTVDEFKPFPGVGPVYLHKFLADRVQLDWSTMASITKTGELSPLVDVRVGAGDVKLMGETLSGATVTLVPKVISPPTPWARLIYSLVIVDYNGNALIPAWSITITVPGKEYRVSYTLINYNSG